MQEKHREPQLPQAGVNASAEGKYSTTNELHINLNLLAINTFSLIIIPKSE